LRRPWVAALVVLAVYAGLALLNSTGGYLGTDTGAKVITLDRMVEEGTIRPDIGYWAEEWDPQGEYHPLFDTRRNDEGGWVNVTTLPMLIASQPLYELGGYRLALLWPMLGSIISAFACRDIARQLAGEREGWWTFWIVALASPLTVYALDLWEHSLGAGLMLTAIALLLRAFESPRWSLLAIGAGLLFGASATMRAESFVVAFVAVGTACARLLVHRLPVRSVGVGVSALAAFAVPWLANAALETQLAANRRTERVTGQAGREWWTELSERGEEALLTWFGLPGVAYPGNVILGVCAVGALVLAVVLHRRGEGRSALLAIGAVAVIFALSFSSGRSFVSGALIASPFAGLAVLGRRTSAYWWLFGTALAMTALTWMFQLTGGAGPQWGGRYILVPTLLLTTLGIVALLAHGDRSTVVIVTGLAALVTAFGVSWLNHRSHEVEEFFEQLAARPEDVVISDNGFLVREAGPAYEDGRYLSVGRRGTVAGAVDVVADAGFETFAVLTRRSAPPEIDGELAGSTEVRFLGVPLWYHSFRLG